MPGCNRPDWRAEIGRRLTHLGLATAREAEIVEELSQHLDDRFEELSLQGVPERDARDAALAELLDTESLARGLRGIEREKGPQPIRPA
ncbi:MAG: permease prefix domain 1-containing protein [Gemmatimonadaceae bacterium]